MKSLTAPTLDDVYAARECTRSLAPRIPLVRLDAERGPEVFLKLENLHPIGSFKLRGAANAVARAPASSLVQGIYTASAGNMAQGVAWVARARNLRARVLVPEQAPEVKVAAIEALGAMVERIPFEQWWRIITEGGGDTLSGYFIHPACNRDVMAGAGVIALEILDERPDIDAIYVPYGGGGLATGIASVTSALCPRIQVIACEVENAAPLAAAFAVGRPTPISYQKSFVDGIGSPCVLESMWPLVSTLIARSVSVDLAQIEDAIRLLALRHHVIAEGAGATPVAAAHLHGSSGQRVACVVSGGNLNPSEICRILAEPAREMPLERAEQNVQRPRILAS